MTNDEQNSGNMRDVFISYSFADKAIAAELAQAIIDAGGTVFLAEKDINFGAKIPEVIRDYLIAARQIWLILSPSSIESKWVQRELAVAWGLGKHIVPILFQCDISRLPYELQGIKTVNFHEYPKLIAEKFPKQPPISVPTEEEMTIIDDLLSRDKIIDAVAEGRKYLIRGEYPKSLAVLEYMRDKANSKDKDYYIILGNIAYNLVHLNRDNEALEYLVSVERLCPEPFFPWHAMARAAAFLHLGEEEKCILWVRYAEAHPKYDQKERKDTMNHYPELIPYLTPSNKNTHT